MTNTMTDTITTSATISPQVFASINSLAVFADPVNKSLTPVITGLRATRTGDTQLTIVVTNRYVAAQATYDNVSFSNWDNDTQFWIDPTVLKQAATVSKGNTLDMVSLGYDNDTEDSFVSVGSTRFTYRQMTTNYPPVDRIINDIGEPNGAQTLSLKIQWIALLGKIVTPETKHDKDRPWLFSFFHDGDSGKPKPVLANVSGEDYDIRVLIQPNLIVR